MEPTYHKGNSTNHGWYSEEKGVPIGTIRMIHGNLYYAWTELDKGLFKKPRVLWRLVFPYKDKLFTNPRLCAVPDLKTRK
jgi:hypothetical protein